MYNWESPKLLSFFITMKNTFETLWCIAISKRFYRTKSFIELRSDYISSGSQKRNLFNFSNLLNWRVRSCPKSHLSNILFVRHFHNFSGKWNSHFSENYHMFCFSGSSFVRRSFVRQSIERSQLSDNITSLICPTNIVKSPNYPLSDLCMCWTNDTFAWCVGQMRFFYVLDKWDICIICRTNEILIWCRTSDMLLVCQTTALRKNGLSDK